MKYYTCIFTEICSRVQLKSIIIAIYYFYNFGLLGLELIDDYFIWEISHFIDHCKNFTE